MLPVDGTRSVVNAKADPCAALDKLVQADKATGITVFEDGKLRAIAFAKMGAFSNELQRGMLGYIEVYYADRLRLIIDDEKLARSLLDKEKSRSDSWVRSMLAMKLECLEIIGNLMLSASQESKDMRKRANRHMDRFMNVVGMGHAMVSLDNQLPYTGLPIVTFTQPSSTIKLALPIIVEGTSDENFAAKLQSIAEHTLRTATVILGVIHDKEEQARDDATELAGALSGSRIQEVARA